VLAVWKFKLSAGEQDISLPSGAGPLGIALEPCSRDMLVLVDPDKSYEVLTVLVVATGEEVPLIKYHIPAGEQFKFDSERKAKPGYLGSWSSGQQLWHAFWWWKPLAQTKQGDEHGLEKDPCDHY
jgi:hypothetical protein